MKTYRIRPAGGVQSLVLSERSAAPLAADQVRVRIHAVSLNYRDLAIAKGELPGSDVPVIPASDGAGEIVEVGAAVTRWRIGERVTTNFFQHWIDGRIDPHKVRDPLGAKVDGVLSQEIVIGEHSLVPVPRHLSYVEAATLPCAALTAWNALFVQGRLKPGDSVLVLGTGGVSVWAVQLAKAAGLRVLATSSSDAKLARVRALGADVGINYATTPEWQDEVLRATGGLGVNLVIEVGGKDTLARSIAAAAPGGDIAIIGGLGGGFPGQFDPFALMLGGKRLLGVAVGSREMAENLSRFVEVTGIKPVVDRVFDFEQGLEAYRYLEAGRHFGKVAIRVAA